jgi:HK97 family phage portal protein
MIMPRTSFDYKREVDGNQSAIIMACVGWAMRTFPEAPVIIEKRSPGGEMERVYEHPFLHLMEQPNPYYDGQLMQMSLIADWMISGNVYWRKVRSKVGRVVELLYIPSTLCEPHWPYDGSKYIDYYEVYTGTTTDQIPPEDIIHFRNGLDPSNIRKGRSQLQSLFREIFTDDEAANMTAALLKNLGVPGLVISPGKGMSASTEDAKDTKQWFKDNFTSDKRGEPLVMKGETIVQMFGFNPQQMDLKSLRRIPEERCSAVEGIPAVVAGLGAGLDRSTFANFKEAREAAYESFIIPTQRLIASVLRNQLLNEFQDDLKLWQVGFDLSDVRILQEDETAIVDRANKMVQGGILMVSDAQRMCGAPVDENANYYLRPFTQQVVTPENAIVEEETTIEQPTSKPSTTGDVAENIAAGEKLNGIQIQAALTVIRDFINGQIPDTVAVELLVAVGIDRERATAMIAEAARFTPEPLPADTPQTEPIKQLKSFKSKLTDEQKEINWKAYVTTAEGYEKQFIPKLKAMFAAQEKETVKRVKQGNKDPFDKEKAKKQYIEAAKPVLTNVLKWAIADAQDKVSSQKGLKSSVAFEQALKWLSTRLTWAAEAISEETAIKIENILSAGYAEGLGADELAGRVKEVFDMSDMRSLRIARTETIQASSQGAIEGYKELGVQRVEFFAALDERTCKDCGETLHGEEFPIAESEGVITVHPNCRCVWLPVVE